jgi:transposase
MLEFDKKEYITNIENLKDLVTTIFTIISDIYERVTPTEIKQRKGIKGMKMSDVEIITIVITGELMSIDSERAWYGFCRKNLSDLFPRFCERSRFNRIRRNLHNVINEMRRAISEIVVPSDTQIIDSLPLPVCKFGRAHFHKTYKGYGACYGYCASKKETYFGYKLHLLCDLKGYPVDFLLTPANVDNRKPVAELIENHSVTALFADKGYTGDDFACDLKRQTGIDIFPLPKQISKQIKEEKPLRQYIFKKRRRIETTGSQFSDQLNLQRVRSKSLWGLFTRLNTKFLAFAVAFLINIIIGFPNPICIKHLVF